MLIEFIIQWIVEKLLSKIIKIEKLPCFLLSKYSKSSWAIENVTEIIEIKDKKGNFVKDIFVGTIKALRPLDRITTKLSSDGSIDDGTIKVFPGRKEIENESGTKCVTQIFDAVISPNGIQLVKIEYSHKMAFRNPKEYYIYRITHIIFGTLQLIVVFPNERPPTTWEITRTFFDGTDYEYQKIKPKLTTIAQLIKEGRLNIKEFKNSNNNRPVIFWEIKKPPLHAVYKLVWTW